MSISHGPALSPEDWEASVRDLAEFAREQAEVAGVETPSESAVILRTPVGELVQEGSSQLNHFGDSAGDSSYTADDTTENIGQKILVVDDDPSVAETVTSVLRGEGFDTEVITEGAQALTAVHELQPDLVLLDVTLPDMNGTDVTRILRADSGVPIVMITTGTDTVDGPLGLESGADDYMMKPIRANELIARVRARLRRNEEDRTEVFSIGDVEINVSTRTVTRRGEQIPLTPPEFDVLVTLARRPGQVITRDVLLQHVRGYRHLPDTGLLDVYVGRLRAKLEKDPEDPQLVVSFRDVGYVAGPPRFKVAGRPPSKAANPLLD